MITYFFDAKTAIDAGSNTGPTILAKGGIGRALAATSSGSAAIEAKGGDRTTGIIATCIEGAGVFGANIASPPTADVGGVCGYGPLTAGVVGRTKSGRGVSGFSGLAGVGGHFESGGVVAGLWVHGKAAEFIGSVNISGQVNKSAVAFRIDHPLDPANKYLFHSSVESPDMKNLYDGVATLDAKGRAVVRLPAWFGALNRDLRYQLTALGRPAPNLHIAREVRDNAFVIAGGPARARVCWQVTGVRHDKWAEAHRIAVEQRKGRAERGRYLHPELFGSKSLPIGVEKPRLVRGKAKAPRR